MPQQKICTKLSMNLFKIVYRQKKKKKKRAILCHGCNK